MTPREQLIDWVKLKHQGQLIRRSHRLYFEHLIFVAEIVREVTIYGYETGLCHDILEESPTTAAELYTVLQTFGYPVTAALQITACVVELTDVFTKRAYPVLSKVSRKEKEALRLTTISPAAQTVKYADLLDNTNWILTHDRAKAVPYLQKKQALLLTMNKGDQELHAKVTALIRQAIWDLTLI